MEAVQKRYLLVTHTSPDFDAVASVFLWLRAMGKQASDPDISFEFVYPGKRKTLKANDFIVVHFDTGNKFNPKTNDFDHHQDTKRWPSAARTVLSAFPDLKDDRILNDIVDFADRVDSGNNANPEDPTDKNFRNAFNERLRSLNNSKMQKVILVTEQAGPWETLDLIFNMETDIGEIADIDKLLVSLVALKKWHQAKTKIGDKRLEDSFSMLPKDRLFFDRVSATFLSLQASGRGIYELTNDELEKLAKTLPDEDKKTLSQSVYDNSPSLWKNPLFQEIVDTTQLIMFKNVLIEETEETRRAKEEISALMADKNKGRKFPFLPVTIKRGPWNVAQLFPDDLFPPHARLIIGLIMMKAWWNKKTLQSRVKPLIELAKWTKTDDGLTFVQMGETSISSKHIRSVFRSYLYRDKVNVFTAIYIDNHTGAKSVGITRVRKNLNGMDALYKRLVELDPTAEIFIYQPSRFVIYVRYIDATNQILTPERIHEEAMKTLHPIHADETPEWEEGEAEEEI